MHRHPPTHRVRCLTFAAGLLVSLCLATGGAQAIMLRDQGDTAGVSLAAGASLPQGVSTLSAPSTTPCSDPSLSSDLGGPFLPPLALCYHGGPVMHQNETFALTWDPGRSYFETTRHVVENFLGDVAAGSGTLTSPYADTSQYNGSYVDANGKSTTGAAENSSIYGGGCIDLGSVGGYTCQFGNTTGSGAGNGYTLNAAAGCTRATGTNQFAELPNGTFGAMPNQFCVTDQQIQSELKSLVPSAGLLQRTKPGYTPLVVVLMPPGVDVCLDSAGGLCSANANTPKTASSFCSYHSQVQMPDGTEVAYEVQPWTAQWTALTGCVEPDAPKIPPVPTPEELAKDAAAQLVSPLSQSQIAAIINPALNGWYANSGAEVQDNGCQPLDQQRDSATVGSNTYLLQREFNNAGMIQTDPNAPKCTPNVTLTPTFAVPGAVNAGDAVQFDGSTTASTLIVPSGNYLWNFGDGKTAIGPSVTHSYAKGGTYSVTLLVGDRGGNVRALSQTISVLGPTGAPVAPVTGPKTVLRVRMQLLPQGMHAMLRRGVVALVNSNEAANGIASVSITRSVAKRAGIRVGQGASVRIGVGTVSALSAGVEEMHLRLSRAVVKHLSRLHHVTLSVRLSLTASGGDHLAIDVAGRY